MTYRTNQQNKALYTLFASLGIDSDTKQELIYEYSGGRTSKSSELYQMEAHKLIGDLAEKANPTKPQTTKLTQEELEAKYPGHKMRRKVISIARELGWFERNSGKFEIGLLNSFLVKYGFGHKTLNEYNYEELPRLISQMEKIQVKDYVTAKKHLR